jgi:prepilin-type N-terminal cleavage/methylation domain-containing protein
MGMIRHRNKNRKSGQQSGLTLIELMIAMVVLAVGILGSMALIVRAIGGDAWSKQLSNSTVLAQAITERIMAIPAASNTPVTIADCTNNPAATVNTAPGGSAVTSSGDVDFTAAPVANYQMLYTDCNTNGRQAIYDVRWNIAAIPNSLGFAKMVTVSAQLKHTGNNAVAFAPVATVRTIIGQGT